MLANFEKIYQFIKDNDRIPSVPETIDLLGFSYHYAANIRRRALRELPRIDMEDISDAVKEQILKRVRAGDYETFSDLVRLMPWVAPPMTPAVDVKQEITHRFIVVKPGDEEPAKEKADSE